MTSKYAISREYLLHPLPLVYIIGLDKQAHINGSSDIDLDANPLLTQGNRLIDFAFEPVEPALAKDLVKRLRYRSAPYKVWQHESESTTGSKTDKAPETNSKNARNKDKPRVLHMQFHDANSCVVAADKSAESGLYPGQNKHSLISPRTPGSALYPDIPLNRFWLQKYLYVCPSTTILFARLPPNSANDEQLAVHLANLRSSLALHVAKLMVVMVLDSASEEEESRMYNLRRSSGLAARSGLFSLVATASDLERDTLIDTVCGLAYAQGLEFAVSTAKNIRKKKNGKIDPITISPDTTPTSSSQSSSPGLLSHVLPTSGWQFRYTFKVAFLAEYRKDFDSAQDQYEAAYDIGIELLERAHAAQGSEITQQSILALIQLLDATAMKIVKLRLYARQPNTAYRKFMFHLESVSQLYGFRGADKEVDNNQIHQWRAQQVLCFANLVADAGAFAISPDRAVTVYPRAKPGNLINAGYLFLDAGRGFVECNDFTNSVDAFTKSIEYFRTFELDRSAAYVCMVMANSLVNCTNKSEDNYKQAVSLFKKAATAYRKEAWFAPLEKTLEGLIAVSESDVDKIATMLELTVLGTEDTGKALPHYDSLSTGPMNYTGVCPFKVSFIFSQSESYVGERVDSQFLYELRSTIKSSEKGEFQLTKAVIKFDGGAIDDIVLDGGDEDSKSVQSPIMSKHLFTKAQTVSCSSAELYFTWNAVVQCVQTVSIDESLTVLPRASKVSVETKDMPATVYAGERVCTLFEVINEEDVAIGVPTLEIKATLDDKTLEVDLKAPPKGTCVEPLASAVYQVMFNVPDEVIDNNQSVQLEVLVSYLINEDSITSEEKPNTQTIREALAVSIPVARKVLRATFDVLPRIVLDEWANPFVPYDFATEDAPACHSPFIKKRWELVTFLHHGLDQPADAADAEIQVQNASIEFNCASEVVCELISATQASDDNMSWRFVFDTYRAGNTAKYDAVRTVAAEALVKIDWKRSNESPVNSFNLSAVKLHLTLQEPRVILQLEKSSARATELDATYYLENSTAHILTYDVKMGSNTAFAWQGPKHQFVRMLPYSRRQVKYTMYALNNQSCKDQTLPPLTVYDTFYKRVVPISAGNDQVRSEKGELVCV